MSNHCLINCKPLQCIDKFILIPSSKTFLRKSKPNKLFEIFHQMAELEKIIFFIILTKQNRKMCQIIVWHYNVNTEIFLIVSLIHTYLHKQEKKSSNHCYALHMIWQVFSITLFYEKISILHKYDLILQIFVKWHCKKSVFSLKLTNLP